MRQFIRYLYEYEQGKRTRNVGFVKVEEKSNLCTIHMHGKGFRLESGMAMDLYLFYMKEGRCVGLLQGTMEPTDLSIHYRLAYSPEDVGGKEIYEKMEGVILCAGGQKRYAAVWDDMPVDVEHMVVGEVESVREEPTEEESLQEETEPLGEDTAQEDAMQEEPIEEPIEEEAQLEEAPTEEVPEDVVQAEEVTQVETQSAACTSVRYRKINRKDLAELPRCEWKLANNSFLLHGYHNYGHLLFVEDEGLLFLGVPGVYHERERDVARAFGFSKFHRVEQGVLELVAEERNDMDDFGYWCRQVQRK